MTAILKNGIAASALIMILAAGTAFEPEARGQGGAVAFQPTIGSFLNGAAMNVTPAVSADRRYVRLGVNATFNTVNGFTSYTAPLGAVSGGGAFGAFGGNGLVGFPGGGFGWGGYGGMNGPIGGFGMGGPVGPALVNGGMMLPNMRVNGARSYLAGDFPPQAAVPARGFVRPNAGLFGPAGRNGPLAPVAANPARAGAADDPFDASVNNAPAQQPNVQRPAPAPARRRPAARRHAKRTRLKKPARRPQAQAQAPAALKPVTWDDPKPRADVPKAARADEKPKNEKKARPQGETKRDPAVRRSSMLGPGR